MNKLTTRATVPVLLGLLVLAFAAGRWLAPSEAESGDHAGHAHEDEAAGETTWTCSMHPQVRQPEPGSCPICGMDLIPIKSGDEDGMQEGDLPRLRVSERAASLMRIQTVPVQRREAFANTRLPGKIAIDETRLHTVSAWFGGRVDRLHVDFTGQKVNAGEPLMEIYSPELFGAQEEYLQALRAHGARTDASSQRLLESSRERLRLLGLTSEQLEQIETSGKPSTHLTVVAPVNGFALERQVSVGQYVQTGTPLFTVADLSTVWAELEAFESELDLIQVGQTVELQLLSPSEQSFEGTVSYVDPVVDPAKRSARVRVDLPNEDFRLKPGMLVTGAVKSPVTHGDRDPLIIPASAPLHTGKRAIVYVQIPDSERPTFEAREVTLGRRLDGAYAVRDGLAEGELVVVNGQFKIDSELQIRGRPSMMAPQGGGAPAHDHGAAAGSEQTRTAARDDPRDPPKREPFADSIDASFAQELQPIVNDYLAAVDALAADDLAAARRALESMREQTLEIGEHRFSGQAHVSWMQHYKQLDAAIQAMLAGDDLDDYRDHLQALTTTIESAYANFGGESLAPLNRAFCPMVAGGIGTWLQRAEQIRNPYFGASMLTCGEVFGTLGSDENR